MERWNYGQYLPTKSISPPCGGDMDLVGSWKGYRIGILDEVPENFTKLKYSFKRAGSYVDH